MQLDDVNLGEPSQPPEGWIASQLGDEEDYEDDGSIPDLDQVYHSDDDYDDVPREVMGPMTTQTSDCSIPELGGQVSFLLEK